MGALSPAAEQDGSREMEESCNAMICSVFGKNEKKSVAAGEGKNGNVDMAGVCCEETGSEKVEMDERIWREFPEELLFPILSYLPLQSIFKLRCVCTKWNSLLHNPSFFESCTQVRSQAPFCIRPADEGYAVYNPASDSWHFWPYSFFLNNYSSSMSSSSAVPFWESGAAAGLLLLEGYGDAGRVLYVANPVNKSQKKIPLVLELQDSSTSAIVGMAVDRQSHTFKILAVDHGVPDHVFLYDYTGFEDDEEYDDEPFKFYVYDSKSNSWEKTGRWERGIKQFFQSPVIHKGFVYCLTSDLEAFHLSDAPPNYRVCRAGQQSWLEDSAVVPPDLNFAHLFENRGRLMLGGGVANMKGLVSVHIWELDEEKKVWVEQQRMPTHLVGELSVPMEPHFRSHFSCVASGDYICVTSFSRQLNVCNTVMCNLSTNVWWMLPPYVTRSYPGSFLLEPRLDVLV